MYENFERLLKIKNIRPIDVAKATGINPTVFSDWKSGKSKPGVEKLIAIAAYLDCSVEYLVTGHDRKGQEHFLNDETAKIANEVYHDEWLTKTFDISLELNDEEREMLYDFASRTLMHRLAAYDEAMKRLKKETAETKSKNEIPEI